MNANPSTCRQHLLEGAAVASRWLLGGLFLYMGLKKAMDPVGFLKLVRQYEMVSDPVLLNSIVAVVPWFEAFCGLLLLAGVAVRGSALLLIGMLVPFTLVVLRRALAMQAAEGTPFCTIQFDCGCGAGEVLICTKLVENVGQIFLAGWLLTGCGRKLCARYALRKAG